MKDTVSTSAPAGDQLTPVKDLFNQYVVPSYGRFDLAFSHGSGPYLWDVNGKRYLDMGGGIAVCSLGHAHPGVTQALVEQSRRMVHISNLYYHELQGRLAGEIVQRIAPGKVFFSNSGGEANEGLFKLARKFGHDEGRYEIITTINSFHGRTLAGISATGQDKVKKGFEPMVAGFRHVPYNDLQAMRDALSPATAAILVEGIQGEGGVTPATPEYLLGLRALCDEKKLLLLMDGVQDGYFRTGCFQAFQRIFEGHPAGATFCPDAISMAKSIAAGFPMGAFWVRAPYSDLLGPGTHATTFGGTPLACAVALKVLQIVNDEKLDKKARELGEWLKGELQKLVEAHPKVLKTVRGLGFMLGLELADAVPGFAGSDKPAAIQLVNRLHDAGLLTIPAGLKVIRLLPPLNLTCAQAEEALAILTATVKSLE